MKVSQTRRVLGLLQSVAQRGLSGNEAEDMLRCRDLPKRISELRQQGVLIVRVLRADAFGQRYARYWLADFAPDNHYAEA